MLRKALYICVLHWVVIPLLWGTPPAHGAPDAEPWSYIPRGELTRIWSWGVKPLPPVGLSGSTSDLKYPKNKAELIRDATVENSGGWPTFVAVTDSGYVFVQDAARGCILRWNPEGAIDKVLWCETEVSELEAAVHSGNPELYEPMMECAACCGINGMIARGEKLYLRYSFGKYPQIPWGPEFASVKRSPLHFGFKIMDREGTVLNYWWRKWKWYDAKSWGYATPWLNRFDVDTAGNIHVLRIVPAYSILSYAPSGSLLRRVMLIRDEKNRYYMEPDGPVREEVNGRSYDFGNTDRGAEVREERRIRVEDIAREVADGSPPFELRYVPNIGKAGMAISAKQNGDFILVGYEGRICRVKPDLTIETTRMQNWPGRRYLAFVQKGVILLVPQMEPGLWFVTEQGEVIGKVQTELTFNLKSKSYDFDANWNVFMTTLGKGEGPSELYIYRPDEDLLGRLRAAETSAPADAPQGVGYNVIVDPGRTEDYVCRGPVGADGVAAIRVRLESPDPDASGPFQLRILDGETVVRTIVQENRAAGTYDETWNGGSDSGLPAATGTYTIKAEWNPAGAVSTDEECELTVVKVTAVCEETLVKLGDSLPVTYTIEPAGLNFPAWLEVRNTHDVLIYSSAVDGDSGTHQTSWPKLKWNQPDHADSYANPGNSPYSVTVRLAMGSTGCVSNSEVIGTELVIQGSFGDPMSAGASRSAGLDDILDTLKVVMKRGASETIVQGTESIQVEGPYNQKHITVRDPSINALPDGEYQVLFRDLRDAIGNFADADNDPSNGIQEVGFSLSLW